MHKKLPAVEGGRKYMEKLRNISNHQREEKSIYILINLVHTVVLPIFPLYTEEL